MAIPPEASEAISLEVVRAELERVLASNEFSSAARASRFLRFVVEESICGRGGDLKEYVIGAEVFDRGASFDPRTDSVVRVEARRLRKRLIEYYTNTGQSDPIRIELPKGTYAPVFSVASSDGDKTGRPPVHRSLWPAVWIIAACVVLAGAFLAWNRGEPVFHKHSSIAVLPFLDLSDETGSVFADGLVDELTQTLSRIDGLRVAARTSAFQFRGKNEDVRSIGRQLNVSAVLEGSVRQMGSRYRVTAQLIDASDGFHLWARSYDCDPAETFSVQEQISTDIARALALRLVAHNQEPLNRRYSASPAAQEHYLQGRYYWNKRTAESLREAIHHYDEAIAADSGFALAYADLAAAHAVMALNDQAPLADSIRSAKEALGTALALDSSLAEAHATLAWIRFFHDWQWREAEDLFLRSLKLNPNHSTGRQWYGLSLIAMGRFREALEQFREAKLLDPLSPIVSTDIGVTYYYQRDFGAAIREIDKTLGANPDFFYAHLLKGASLLQTGDAAGAIGSLERAVELSEGDSDALMRLAHAKAISGARGAAQDMVNELIRRAGETGSSCYHVGAVYAGMREPENAMEWLGKAAANREASMVLLNVEPIFDSLRDRPEYRELLRRHGLDTVIRP